MEEAKIEMITPEKAREYLKMNTHNRDVNRNHVEFIKRQIMEGKWIFNGQSVSISSENVILDGQHRLIAISELNKVSVKTLIVTGLDPRAMNTIDCNRLTRNLSDFFKLEGIKNSNNISALTTHYIRLSKGMNEVGQHGILGRINRVSVLKVSVQEVINVYFEHSQLFDEIYKFANSFYNKKRLMSIATVGGVIAHLVVNLGYDFDFVKEFFERIDRLGDDVCGMFGNILLKDKIQTMKLTITYKAQLLVKTWNYYVIGKEVKILKYDPVVEGRLYFTPNNRLNLN